MKKIIPLLLILLLLGGCALQPHGPVEPETSLTETPSVTPEPPATSVLPNGMAVQTDYSQYSAAQLSTVNGGRLSPDFIGELLPSEDYGRIYPFIGELVEAQWFTEYRYGLIDATGRIIVDPVYSFVRLMSYGNAEYETEQLLPMWILTQPVELEEDSSDAYGQQVQECKAIATLDGSFVSEMIYDSVQTDGEYIACGNAERIDVYDTKGKLTNSIRLPETMGEIWWWTLSEGILMLTVEDEAAVYGQSAYYMDTEGTLLGGPYRSAAGFSYGYGRVELENGNYVFVDRQGNYLLGRQFSQCDGFYEDRAAGIDAQSGEALFFDSKGNIYFSQETADSVTWYGSELRVDDHRGQTFYNAQGQPMEDPYEGGATALYLDGRLAGKDSLLTNVATGKTYTPKETDGYYDAFWNAGYEDFPYIRYMWWDTYYLDHYILLNEDLEEVLQGEGWPDVQRDLLTGECYLVIQNAGAYTVYSSGMQKLLEGKGSVMSIYDGRILCQEARCCSYYELSGKVFFRTPMNNLGED